MANEIRASATLQITKDGFTVTGNTTQTVSMTGSVYDGTVQMVGTSYESIPLGDLGDIRYLFLMNNSTASVFVSLGGSDTGSLAILRPDDVLLLPPSSSFTAYKLKSTAVNSPVQVVMVES